MPYSPHPLKNLSHFLFATLTTLSLITPPAFADDKQDGYGLGGATWSNYLKNSSTQDPTAGGVLSVPQTTYSSSPANTTQSTKGGGANFTATISTPITCSSAISATNPTRFTLNGLYGRITSCNPTTFEASFQICPQGFLGASTCPDTTPDLITQNYPLQWTTSGNNHQYSAPPPTSTLFTWACTLTATSPTASTPCTLTASGNVFLIKSKAELDNAASTPSDIKDNQKAATSSQEYQSATSSAANMASCTTATVNPTTGERTYSTCADPTTGETAQIATSNTTTPSGNPQCSTSYTNECASYSTQTNSTTKACSIATEVVDRIQTVEQHETTSQCSATFTLKNQPLYYLTDYEFFAYYGCQRIDIPNNSGPTTYTVWCQLPVDDNYALVNVPDVKNLPDSLLTPSGSCNPATQNNVLIGSSDSYSCTGASVCTPDTGNSGDSFSEPSCYCTQTTLTRSYSYKQYTPTITATTYDEPPHGTCDASLLAETQVSLCTSGWSNRTLPADQCTISKFNSLLGANITVELSDIQKTGCGTCQKAEVHATCMTDAKSYSCDANTLAGCSLISTTPDSFLGSNVGMSTSILETYSCQNTTQVCTQYKLNPASPSCLSSDMAAGTDTAPTQSTDGAQSFSKAMQTMAVVKEVAKSSSTSSASDPNISIFAGKNLRCSRPRNFITGALQKNCCKLGIDRPSKSVLTQEGCSQDEAELSASREKNNTHYLGEYCSSKSCILGMCTCKEFTQSYCSFPSTLPRIVQEEGRNQLASIISAGPTSATQSTTTFNYYANNGQWSPIFTSNGIQTAYWSWPNACQDPAVSAQRAFASDDQPPCPGALSLWVASCITNNCSALPAYPEKDSLSWSLTKLDALAANSMTATSPFSTVQGNCNTSASTCTFTATHLPRQGNAKAVTTQKVAWTLTNSTDPVSDSTTYTEAQYTSMCLQNYPASKCPPNTPMPDAYKRVPSAPTSSTFAIGSTLLRPMSLLPSTADILYWKYSTNNGTNWTTFTTPATISAPLAITLNDGNTISLLGRCSSTTLLCSFTATTSSSISAKPWGTPENPDCSGFTTTQLGVLDFDKMDLGAWTSTLATTLSPNVPTPDSISNPANTTKLQQDQLNGTTQLTNKSAAPFVTLSTTDGFGPFPVTVNVPRATPSKDNVISASIDWGTCSSPQPIPFSNSVFTLTATLPDPKVAWQQCQLPKEADFSHKVVVSVSFTTAPTQKYTFTILNRWGSSSSPSPSSTSTIPSYNKGTLPGR